MNNSNTLKSYFDRLQKEFDEECEEIAAECEAEGLPSHGSSYKLRVEALKESSYFVPLFTR